MVTSLLSFFSLRAHFVPAGLCRGVLGTSSGGDKIFRKGREEPFLLKFNVPLKVFDWYTTKDRFMLSWK